MKKAPMILLAVTAAFFCMLLGFFIGRNVTEEYVLLKHPQSSTSTTTTAPATETNTAAANVSAATQRPTEPATAATQAQEKGKYNLNTATAEQLQELPGIGEVIANRIVSYREVNGGFTAIEDICLVDGIGEKRFEQIKDFITVGG